MITSIVTNPFFVQIILIFIAALCAFVLAQYIIKPRRCELQRKDCFEAMEKLGLAQNEKRHINRIQLNDSIQAVRMDLDDIENRVERLVDRSDDIYVRRDVVLPQLKMIQNEVTELKNLVFKFVKLNGNSGS